MRNVLLIFLGNAAISLLDYFLSGWFFNHGQEAGFIWGLVFTMCFYFIIGVILTDKKSVVSVYKSVLVYIFVLFFFWLGAWFNFNGIENIKGQFFEWFYVLLFGYQTPFILALSNSSFEFFQLLIRRQYHVLQILLLVVPCIFI
ncbi:MAG: hypothetical protein ABFD18_01595 [Syntrophomonas sp.]